MAGLQRRERKNADGKKTIVYRVSWYDAIGKQVRKDFALEREAKLFRASIEKTAKTTEGSKITVQQAGELWWERVKAAGREWSTYEKYQQHLRDHIEPVVIERPGKRPRHAVFGTLRLDEITTPDCQALKKHLLKKLSFDMAARVMSTLRMLFNDAIREEGQITTNPAQVVRMTKPRRGEEKTILPIKEDVRRILTAAATEPPDPPNFAEVYVRLVGLTGLRPSEARGLAIEDLTLTGNKCGVQVRRRADNRNNIGPLKTERSLRFIPIGEGLAELLRRWMTVVPKANSFPDPHHPARELHLLLPTSIGTMQTYANISHRIWNPLLLSIGLAHEEQIERPALKQKNAKGNGSHSADVMRIVPDYPLGALRHIAASLMIEQGADAKTVMTRMGHSSIQVTYDVYGSLFSERESDTSLANAIEQGLR